MQIDVRTHGSTVSHHSDSLSLSKEVLQLLKTTGLSLGQQAEAIASRVETLQHEEIQQLRLLKTLPPSYFESKANHGPQPTLLYVELKLGSATIPSISKAPIEVNQTLLVRFTQHGLKIIKAPTEHIPFDAPKASLLSQPQDTQVSRSPAARMTETQHSLPPSTSATKQQSPQLQASPTAPTTTHSDRPLGNSRSTRGLAAASLTKAVDTISQRSNPATPEPSGNSALKPHRPEILPKNSQLTETNNPMRSQQRTQTSATPNTLLTQSVASPRAHAITTPQSSKPGVSESATVNTVNSKGLSSAPELSAKIKMYAGSTLQQNTALPSSIRAGLAEAPRSGFSSLEVFKHASTLQSLVKQWPAGPPPPNLLKLSQGLASLAQEFSVSIQQNTPPSTPQLQQQMQQSGIFWEHRVHSALSQTGTQDKASDNATKLMDDTKDLKSSLYQLLHWLQATQSTFGSGGNALTKQQTLFWQHLLGLVPGVNKSERADNKPPMQTLLNRVEQMIQHSISRIQNQQIQSIARTIQDSSGTTGQHLLMDLPLRHPDGFMHLHMQLSFPSHTKTEEQKERKKKQTRKHSWTIHMQFSIEDEGEMRAELTLHDGELDATLWSDEPSLRKKIAHSMEKLQQDFNLAGLTTRHVTCSTLKPDSTSMSYASSLIHEEI